MSAVVIFFVHAVVLSRSEWMALFRFECFDIKTGDFKVTNLATSPSSSLQSFVCLNWITKNMGRERERDRRI